LEKRVVAAYYVSPADNVTDPSLALLFQSLSLAVKQIASKVARAGLEGLFGVAEQQGGGSGDTQKKLDVVAVSISLLQLIQSCLSGV
jgi:fructose-1,6-bisphosphatase